MPSGELGSVLRHIRRAIGLGKAADSPDRELLERFADRGEEAAFEALLRRHGPLVLGVCRRMLSNPHDVDDAFQATFFIFVRKARAIARGDAVGSWLYRVAYHAAVKVRAAAARRQSREAPLPETEVAAVDTAESWRELQPLVDDAVNRLPEKYRRPIVLCCLEGKSNEEAARELGCPVATVGTRLSRARERLRGWLTRRGVTVPAVALATLLEQSAAPAAVPAALLDTTLKAGMLLSAGETTAAGAFLPGIATLARAVSRDMILARLRVAVIALTFVAVLTGTGWLTFRALAHTAIPLPPEEATPTPATADAAARFATAHRLLKPQAGESRWMEVPWLTSVWEARRRAAAEGKPMLLVAAGKGSALGPCSSTARMFRYPSLWTEDNLRLIQDKFVPVAATVDVLMSRQDAEGTFIREICGFRLNSSGGYVLCVTPGGKWLGSDPKKAWQAFQQLPETQRAPGAVTVGDIGEIDRSVALPEPPPGGLVLKIYARPLSHGADGELRHAVGTEFETTGPQTEEMRVILQASPDYLWLTRDEWQALVPASPRQGERQPVAAAVVRRIFCYHLVPTRIYVAGAPWSPRKIRAGELNLVVEEVTPGQLRMRLEGFAHLGAAYDPNLPLEQHDLGYETELLGFLTYDRRQNVFTRFDLTAIGDVYGSMPMGDGKGTSGASRRGRTPLGFAFELVRGDKPADRIPPTGRYRKGYFETDK